MSDTSFLYVSCPAYSLYIALLELFYLLRCIPNNIGLDSNFLFLDFQQGHSSSPAPQQKHVKEKVIFKRGFSSNSNSNPQKWELQISSWKNDLGATGPLSDLEPWTTMPGLRLAGVSPTTRVKEILNCVCMHNLGGATVTKELMKRRDFYKLVRNQMAGVVCDLSQNPHRVPSQTWKASASA